MMRLENLEGANPITADHDWGTSGAGRALFASVNDRIDDDLAKATPGPNRSRPWLYAIGGFAATLVLAIPFLLLSGGDVQTPLQLPEGNQTPNSGVGFIEADSLDRILDDNYVTDDELEMAAQATVDCISESSELGEGAGWDWTDNRDGITFLSDVGETILLACEREHFRSVQFVWAAQDGPDPRETYYWHAGTVRCAEARTGTDFGELDQRRNGMVGSATIDATLAAREAAEEVYLTCVLDLASQPLHYYFVLECVTAMTGDDYPNLTDPGPGRLTSGQLDILDGARSAHPESFEVCMGEVALD